MRLYIPIEIFIFFSPGLFWENCQKTKKDTDIRIFPVIIFRLIKPYRQRLLLLLQCCKALAAVYRSVAGGLEGNLSFLAASCANSGEELSLRLSGVLSCIAASFASLGLVLEALLCIEFLLACGENKFSAAILTDQFLILIHCVLPRLCSKKIFLPKTDSNRHL